MAAEVDPAVRSRVIEVLRSVGFEGVSKDMSDAALRKSTLDGMNLLNRLFIDPRASSVTAFDPDLIAKVNKKLGDEFDVPNPETGRTGLQNFQAVVDADVDTLAKSAGILEHPAKFQFNRIYTKHGASGRDQAIIEVLQAVSGKNPFVAEILPRLTREGLTRHVPATLELVKNRGQFFADLKALDEAGLYAAPPSAAPEKIEVAESPAPTPEDSDIESVVAPVVAVAEPEAPLNPAEIFDQALATIKGTLGGIAGPELDRNDQVLIKTEMLALQNDAFFGEGWTGPKDGIYTPELAAHLDARVTLMPEGTPEEQASKNNVQKFVQALHTLSEDYNLDLRHPRDRIYPADASASVEQGLSVMTPMLNSLLDEKRAQMDGAFKDMPDWVKNIGQALAGMGAGNLLNTRIPQAGTPDAVFDMRSQGALQALLMVLADNNVMGIPGMKNGIYEPAHGQRMLAGIGPLKEKLKADMSPEKFAEIEGMLSAENIQGLIDNLDVLHAAGKIAQEPFFIENRAGDLPGLSAGILSEEVHRLEQENPDALKVMDGLLREYTGLYGISGLLPGHEDMAAGIDASLSPEKRLAEFYKDARAQHLQKGGSSESFDGEMIVILNTILAMPFGSAEHKNLFSGGVREALRLATAEPKADRAGEIFAQGVVSTGAAMNAQIGSAGFTHSSAGPLPLVWHPRLETSSFVSGGKTYTGSDIARLYDDFNEARGALRGHEAALFFTDDVGDMYVAAIHEGSNMFMVEKVNKENMQLLWDAGGAPEQAAALKESDPAFGLVFQAKKHLDAGYMNFAERVLFPVGAQSLDQMARVDYAAQTQDRLQRESPQSFRKANQRPAYISSGAPPEISKEASLSGGQQRGPAAGDDPYIMPAFHTIGSNDSALRKDLTVVASTLARGPGVYYPDDPRLKTLKAAVGEWRIGAFYKSNFELKRVDDTRSSHAGAQVAWYDREEKAVKFADAPPEMLNPDLRAAMSMKTSETPQGYFERIQRDYPLFFEIAESYHGAPGRLQNEPLRTEHYWNFHLTVDRVAAAMALRDGPAQTSPPKQSLLAGLFNKGEREVTQPVAAHSQVVKSQDIPPAAHEEPDQTQSESGGALQRISCEFKKIGSQILASKTMDCVQASQSVPEDKTTAFKTAGAEITGPATGMPDGASPSTLRVRPI
ncbi:MAG: hypothetical protein IT559_04700 [Alphaproteobacteria bacterium]|nr:hypothetical protein [Alphaproteobacteria bacterium]